MTTTTEIWVWVRTYANDETEEQTDREIASAELWERKADGTGAQLQMLVDTDADPETSLADCEEGLWTERLERELIKIPLDPTTIDWSAVELDAGSDYQVSLLIDEVEYEGEDGDGYSSGETYQVTDDGSISVYEEDDEDDEDEDEEVAA